MRYEFRVTGTMSDALREEGFPELESVVVSSQTVLIGQIVDDAQLYGLLARFQSLGLRVAEFRQLPE
ncbi:hypothetical protein [Yinghuangia seranimata]|uniref:hypothetical protein n=1 Tax=Yinghuangia seranimata TaxID=408067 RepID=UPI00248BB7D2|nr:hypothetical protein [Yinghuangia seranimata]MDI2126519.1 hypothetical protein [Yinghuangia seranimata]